MGVCVEGWEDHCGDVEALVGFMTGMPLWSVQVGLSETSWVCQGCRGSALAQYRPTTLGRF